MRLAGEGAAESKLIKVRETSKRGGEREPRGVGWGGGGKKREHAWRYQRKRRDLNETATPPPAGPQVRV